MEIFRHLQRALVAIAALLLVSCIDCHEEIWLNADGSGRADIRYSLPATAARFQGGAEGVSRIIGDFLKRTTAIKSSTHEVVTEGDRLKIHVTGTFDSVLDFRDLAHDDSTEKLPSSASGLAGDVKVKRSGREIDFSRVISPGTALPGSIFMPASQFKDRNLTYIVHLPIVPLESNATRTEDGGSTLIWDYPLSQAIRQPVATNFKVKIPIPNWMLVSAAATLLAVGTITVVAIQKIRSLRNF